MTGVSRRLRWAGEASLVIVVFAVALAVFWTAKAKIDSDEGNWIGTTRYFETFFVRRDFSPEAWADGYWTRTQPMIFRYVIGSWLWYRGHDLDAQNPNYDYSKTAQANRRLGLAPADDVLDDARMPARLMAALAAVMLYLVVRILAGPVGGLAAAASTIGSPYLEENLIRAKAESTLMFFLLAALLLAIVSVWRPRSAWSNVGWGVATGVLLGLAFGVKLTVVLALIAVTVWGAGACYLARRRGTLGQEKPWVWPLAVLVTVAVVFIGSNPFTWPNPIMRSWLLFENRRDEMAQQQIDVPSRAVHSLDHRAALVWDRSVWNDAFGPSRLNQPLEAVLTVVGAIWLAARAAQILPGRRDPGRRRAEIMVLLWSALLWAGVTAGLGFLLQHYFVPTAVIATLLSGLAIGWAVQAILGVLGMALHRRPQRARQPASPLRA
jgi:4-amino-4-deoxy-L-arabinose transferase-like glycosyltransferase